MEIIYLNCPFQDKDLAKQHGARWNAAAKKWYITSDMALTNFKAWLPEGTLIPETTEGEPLNVVDTDQYTIRQFIQQVQNVFYQNFNRSVWLIGQITRIKQLGKGHSVELIDQQDNGSMTNACSLTVNAWGEQWNKIQEKMVNAFGQGLTEGMLVRLQIQPEFHPRYHLGGKILDIDPAVTLGEFALMQQKLKAKLQSAGILHLNRELVPPLDFCRVAVIHPQGASGYHDFKTEADKLEKLGLCHFYYYASRFEGDAAENDLMQAFNSVRDLHANDPIDALVIIRGGGARQGLLNLIKYSVLEQICTFPVPVITGLGHADDMLLIEEVSCLRRDTPSKAIHYILNTIVNRAAQTLKNWQIIFTESHKTLIRQKHDVRVCMLNIKDSSQGLIYRMLQRLHDLKNHIHRQTTTHWRQLQNQLQSYQQLIFRSQLQLNREQHNLEQIIFTIKQQTRWLLQHCQQQIEANNELIKAYDPERVLERGYSLSLSTQGKVIRNKELAAEQKEFIVKFYDGELPVIPQNKSRGV